MSYLIFLHGGPGFKDYLEPYFPKLIGKYNCTYYNQLQGKDLKVDDLIMQLDEIVREKDTQVALLGHSWGGVLATEYVKRNPSRIKSLILMSTGLNSQQWTLYNRELEESGRSDISREELFFTASETQAGKRLFEHECWNGFSEETFDAIFSDYLKSYNLLEVLGDFTMPILNIYGEKDLRFSTDITETFKGYNSKIQNLEIKDSGHFPYILDQNRNHIVSKIEEFLAN